MSIPVCLCANSWPDPWRPLSSFLPADGEEPQPTAFHSPGEERHRGALVKILEQFKRLKPLYKLKVSKSSKLLKAI